MALPAGKFDQRIGFEVASETTDDHGEAVLSWATLAERWAAVFYGRGDERRAAAMEGGAQAATFVVRADEVTRTIGLTHRIGYGGSWDIKGVAPRGTAEIEFSAVRAS